VPEICRGRNGARAELVRVLARLERPLRFTELVDFCEPDGTAGRELRAPTTAATSTGAWTGEGRGDALGDCSIWQRGDG